jgi:hypothetical protein
VPEPDVQLELARNAARLVLAPDVRLAMVPGA